MGRVRAVLPTQYALYPLVQISVEEMSSVLSDEKLGSVIGMPQFFDARERVWPLPKEGTPSVVFLSDP